MGPQLTVNGALKKRFGSLFMLALHFKEVNDSMNMFFVVGFRHLFEISIS